MSELKEIILIKCEIVIQKKMKTYYKYPNKFVLSIWLASIAPASTSCRISVSENSVFFFAIEPILSLELVLGVR